MSLGVVIEVGHHLYIYYTFSFDLWLPTYDFQAQLLNYTMKSRLHWSLTSFKTIIYYYIIFCVCVCVCVCVCIYVTRYASLVCLASAVLLFTVVLLKGPGLVAVAALSAGAQKSIVLDKSVVFYPLMLVRLLDFAASVVRAASSNFRNKGRWQV